MATERWHLRSVVDAANAILKSANEPARRFRLIWNLFGIGLVGLFAIIGSGYIVGGSKATNSMTLQLLINLEFGSYRVHGAILLALALFLANGLGPHYRLVTRLALMLVMFYSAVAATMIFGGWFIYNISFGAPWWYVYTCFNSMVLLILAPSVLSVPIPIVDDEPGAEGGGESA